MPFCIFFTHDYDVIPVEAVFENPFFIFNCFILDYQSQSMQSPLQPITMDPNPVTVPNDDDVITIEADFENPFFVFF